LSSADRRRGDRELDRQASGVDQAATRCATGSVTETPAITAGPVIADRMCGADMTDASARTAI
jgi:hypothetical protein